MSEFYVYYLADARFPRWPRYVGLTYDPALRLDTHRKHAPSANATLTTWKAVVSRAGSRIILRVVQTFPTREEGRAFEWRTIRRWRRRGLCDANSQRDGQFDAFAREWTVRRAREARP